MLPLCKNWRYRTKTLINMSFLKLSVTLILISVSSVVFAQKIKGGQVSIVDMAGRLLLQQNLEPNISMINTTELTNGVYNVIVEVDNARWAKKLIISK